ncbi:MAG: peptidoglycan bridge formation glycyltransferase FemA/FemB family protein [Candidatus Limnocylindrales bacterium]
MTQVQIGPAGDATTLAAETAAWDAFVAGAPSGSYMQLTAWAEVKAVNGWRSTRLAVDGPDGPFGAQVLIHDLGRTPWSVGYAPRGPVAATLTQHGLAAWTGAVREVARHRRLSHVTIEPQVPAGEGLESTLEACGWRRARTIQDRRTRIIDLERPEPEVWADLRSKWRQYVNKARREGVVVVETGEEGIPDFNRIYVETAQRAGFVHRAESAYRDVYRAFAARDAGRLLFARLPGGEPVAALMLLECGRRVIEPYGGMTEAGGASRANYLLKWEAIRSSREHGFAIYDLWGVAHPGIERFKAGFGGREVRYVGAWELVVDPLVHAAVGGARRLRVAMARRSQGVSGAQRADEDAR